MFGTLWNEPLWNGPNAIPGGIPPFVFLIPMGADVQHLNSNIGSIQAVLSGIGSMAALESHVGSAESLTGGVSSTEGLDSHIGDLKDF